MKSNACMLIGMLALSVSADGFSAEEFQDVKCFVQTSLGPRIVFYSWPEDKLDVESQRLAGSAIGKEKGIENYVKKVKECVPMYSEFASPQARKLDAEILK